MPILADKNTCTGCTACKNICPKNCIEMKSDANGFVFPQITNTSTCINCNACEKVCPVLTGMNKDNLLPQAYAVISKNELWRIESSSGGMFSEIAGVVLENNGIVYGAVYNEEFKVYHCGIESLEELSKLRGAKYSQSDLGSTFSDILSRLKQGKLVLFSGTPCQVAGLKSFLRKDYDNLVCVDFVCHGVPSPMAWREYIKHRAIIDNNGKYPVSINLRSKETGWSEYRYSNVFEYDGGKRHSCLSSDGLFMKLFVGDYISRLSCDNCKFKGYERVSDITLGDFWGIWDVDSEMDDDKGTSVGLLHSEKGKKLFEDISDNLRFKQVTLEEASRYNPSMLVSSKSKEERNEVLKMIRDGNIERCNELFIPKKISLIDRAKNKVKYYMSKLKS